MKKHLTAHPNFHRNVFVILYKKKCKGSPYYANFGILIKLRYKKVVEVFQITQLMQIPPTERYISENCVSENHVIGWMPLKGFPQYVTKKQFIFIT